jgi:hypothetical protein
MIEGEAPVRSLDDRETLLARCLVSGWPSSRGASQGASIVLIDCRPLTRQCLTRWLQDGSPDLHIIPIANPADLLDAANVPSAPTTIIFSIGAGMVRDRDVLGQMTLLRRHLSRISAGPAVRQRRDRRHRRGDGARRARLSRPASSPPKLRRPCAA